MCAECPIGTTPINDALMLAAPCGQHWCVSDGNWKAISRVRFLAETEVRRIEQEKARENLLGPGNIVTLSPDMPRIVKRQDIETMQQTMYCPWLEDWPKEAIYEWEVDWEGDTRLYTLRWQSPFVGTPGVTTLWTETSVTGTFWTSATRRGAPSSLCPVLGDYSEKGESISPL